MVLTEVFKKCYLKAFISLRQGTPQNCQSRTGLCKETTLKWRSEPRLQDTSSSRTAAWPHLKWILHIPQPDFIFPCPRITNTRYNWCRALNTKAFPRCGTLVLQWGSIRRSRISSVSDLVRKSAEAGYSSQFPLCVCNTTNFKPDFMLCKCLEMEFSYKTRVWTETMYSLEKENIQNREFGLNKSLIKNVVYLELQNHTGHISLILHLSEQ